MQKIYQAASSIVREQACLNFSVDQENNFGWKYHIVGAMYVPVTHNHHYISVQKGIYTNPVRPSLIIN